MRISNIRLAAPTDFHLRLAVSTGIDLDGIRDGEQRRVCAGKPRRTSAAGSGSHPGTFTGFFFFNEHRLMLVLHNNCVLILLLSPRTTIVTNARPFGRPPKSITKRS